MTNLTINIVETCQAREMQQFEIAWGDMCTSFSKVGRKGKMTLSEYQVALDAERKQDKDGSAWIPCSAIDPAGKRVQANMQEAFCLVLDIDSGMQLEDVKSRIQGWEAFVHSSFSHSPEKPKWRVILPLAEPIPAKDLGKVFDVFQERFDGRLDATCGHDSAHLYYTPACPADAEHLFQHEHLEGTFLDGKAILASVSATQKSSTVPVSKKMLAPAPASLHAGVAEGGRNNTAFKLAAKMFGEGRDEESVTHELLKWNERNDPPLEESEVRQVVQSARKNIARKGAAADEEVDAIVDAMNAQYAWVQKQQRIYRFAHQDFTTIDLLSKELANTQIWVNDGNRNKLVTHADAWFKSPRRRMHVDVDFVPGADMIVNNCINRWQGWGAMPVAGDVTPWNELLDHLFVGAPEHRKWFEQWVAYPIQRPGTKLTTATVLWSIVQGVGKSLIGETIGMLYGKHFRVISAVELHASFNGWMHDVQFVLGEENSGADPRADANRLKALITGTTVVVNEKYQPALELPNCVNFLFTSNHPDAFYLEDADRRFYVWEISAGRLPNEFYEKFVDWRDNRGGINALMHHLQHLDLTGFLPKGNAPMTKAKLEMIYHSKSDLERWLMDTFEDETAVEAVFGKQVATLEEVTEAYNRERRGRTTTTAVSKALKRHHSHSSRRVSCGRRRHKLRSLVNHEGWELADNTAWAREFEKPALIGARMIL